jgi:hypothetical protein
MFFDDECSPISCRALGLSTAVFYRTLTSTIGKKLMYSVWSILSLPLKAQGDFDIRKI